MKWIRLLIAAAGTLAGLAGCHSAPSTAQIPAVSPFDLSRYLGVWYEAARLPHRFEAGMTRVTAEYRQEPDGTIRVCNRGFKEGKERSIYGVVRQKIPGTGELEVSFFRPFYGAYRIIAVDADYSVALVTSKNKDYAWILVRDPARREQVCADGVKMLRQWGFDVSRLERPF